MEIKFVSIFYFLLHIFSFKIIIYLRFDILNLVFVWDLDIKIENFT